jgi:hypothetical protein
MFPLSPRALVLGFSFCFDTLTFCVSFHFPTRFSLSPVDLLKKSKKKDTAHKKEDILFLPLCSHRTEHLFGYHRI